MAADEPATHPTDPQTPAASVPEQTRRRTRLSPTDRIIRQIRGIDGWVCARRERERTLRAPRLTRDEQMDVAREVEVLRRTHDAIKGRCARELEADAEPMRWPGPTVVIAHRHAWFVDKLALLLGGRGVTVLLCTDNGAEALGAVVAEQPDIVLVGDRLAMMSGRVLLAEARLYAPNALLALQVSDEVQADALRVDVDVDRVFLRHHLPADIADSLVALHLEAAVEPSRA